MKNALHNYIVPNWPAPKLVKAYTTTRKHGYSNPPFASFNLAYHVGDDPAKVTANRSRLAEDLNLPHEPIWIDQVHGINAVRADQIQSVVQADASYTQKAGTVCAILTADCLPLLLCDRNATKVAVIHAGWKGLAAGIIEAILQGLPWTPKETLAWLGPAIGPTIFEVGAEVREQFLQSDPATDAAFIGLMDNREDKYLANIYSIAKQKLAKFGITEVYGGNYCTYTDSELFFSYRRDKGKTGRMATLIWIAK